MKFRFLIAVCAILVLGVVFERSLVKPVLAEVRAALTKNIDEKGRVPYQQRVDCSGIGFSICYATIPPVPAGKRLVLEGIYAQVFAGTSAAPLVSLDNGTNDIAMFQAFSWGGGAYGMNTPILLYVEAGETIRLRAGGVQNTSSAGSVTYTGYLVDLTE